MGKVSEKPSLAADQIQDTDVVPVARGFKLTLATLKTWLAALPQSARGAANGVAELDSGGLLPDNRTPASVSSALATLTSTKANASSLVAKANDNAVVHLTGDETVGGTKTYSVSPLVPNPTSGDNSQKAASTSFVASALAALIGGATPSTLDTLQEIAAALGNDPDLAAHLTAQIAGKLTQAQADALYRAIGWVPAWGDVTGKPDFATQADAEAGTNNAKFMTPLRVAQAITALATGGGGGSSTDLRDIWLFG